jgi:hypothetical protein
MKLDTRLYFLRDPHIYIPLFLAIGLFGATFKHELKQAKPKQKEAVTTVKSDTTEWRKQYYEHLYNTK